MDGGLDIENQTHVNKIGGIQHLNVIEMSKELREEYMYVVLTHLAHEVLVVA